MAQQAAINQMVSGAMQTMEATVDKVSVWRVDLLFEPSVLFIRDATGIYMIFIHIQYCILERIKTPQMYMYYVEVGFVKV